MIHTYIHSVPFRSIPLHYITYIRSTRAGDRCIHNVSSPHVALQLIAHTCLPTYWPISLDLYTRSSLYVQTCTYMCIAIWCEIYIYIILYCMPAEFFRSHSQICKCDLIWIFCFRIYTQPRINQHMPAEFFEAIHRYVNVTKYELFVSGYTHNQA